jgi:methylenetetrahydrofolate dehydrogenase (NADP+)/methenyltetrahydrofolate cyclohydrolase
MESFEHRLPATASETELLALVERLNADDRVDGILVQLPLPPHIDEKRVIATIDPDKDVDGFHVVNAGRLAVGEAGYVPCTPLGCLMLLKDRRGDLSGLEAVVIGRSNIVGKPMAALLLAENCTVTIAHSRTRDLAEVVRRADIVVAAVGRPEMVRGDWIRPGATVIDVGINRVPGAEPGKTRLVGDVAFAEAAAVAGAITPVPGGVGPMTIAVLLRNTLVAAHRRAGVALPEGAIG